MSETEATVEQPTTKAGQRILDEWLMLRPDYPPNTARVRDMIAECEHEARAASQERPQPGDGFDNTTEACRHCPTPDVHPTRIGGILTYEGRCDPDTCEQHDHSEPPASQERPQPDLRAALKAYDKQQITGPELADVVRASQERPQPDELLREWLSWAEEDAPTSDHEAVLYVADGDILVDRTRAFLASASQERPSIDVERLTRILTAIHGDNVPFPRGVPTSPREYAEQILAMDSRLSGPVGE